MMSDRQQQKIESNDPSGVNIAEGGQNVAPPRSRDRVEAILLDAVKREVTARLEQSLHQKLYSQLSDGDAPLPKRRFELQLANAASQLNFKETSILEVFDRTEINGRLLILGESGLGKTTTLLQLASELIKRADRTVEFPVPVLLDFHAWNPKFLTVSNWIVSNLKEKYGVRLDVAYQWIEERRILPLIDSFDELNSFDREQYKSSIEDFLKSWQNIPFVLCSSLERETSKAPSFGLNGSIILQPFTDAEIENYFHKFDRGEFWEKIRQNPQLIEAKTGLARSPLFLTTLLLSRENLPAEFWNAGSDEDRWRILWEAYLNTQLNCPNSSKTEVNSPSEHNEEKTKFWLGKLGRELIHEKRSNFFIEKLQPWFFILDPQNNFRRNYERKFIYSISSNLFEALVLGVTVWLFFGIKYGLLTSYIIFLVSFFTEKINLEIQRMKLNLYSVRENLENILVYLLAVLFLFCLGTILKGCISVLQKYC
ncbi:hypothetical protein AY599_00630 [Leptolyngbya valderiana BDU 20041]|nr:hypothetical protein AY599_00630 [Leptolyngbya valderiana BDU 20041]